MIRKIPKMRKLEKAIRPEGINSAFCQNAFDAAVVQVSGRLNNIRPGSFVRRYGDICTVKSIVRHV